MRFIVKSFDSCVYTQHRGHLKVLQWLSDNLGQRCTSDGLEAAVEGGHLDTVDWFLRTDKSLPTRHAVVLAAANGHPEVLQRLLSEERGEVGRVLYECFDDERDRE